MGNRKKRFDLREVQLKRIQLYWKATGQRCDTSDFFLHPGVKYVVFVKMRRNIFVYAILILKWL